MISSLLAEAVLWVHLAVCVWHSSGELPSCLSETYYTAPRRWCFPVAMLVQVGLLVPGMLEKTSESWQWLCFVLAVGFVGLVVAPYKDSLFKYKVHYVCSVMAMVAMVALYVVECPGKLWLLGTWMILGMVCFRPVRRNWLLVVEMACFGLGWGY